jgi:hypothetical protein
MQKYFLHIFIGCGVVAIGVAAAALYQFNTTAEDLYVVPETNIPMQDTPITGDENVETPVTVPPETTGKIKADMFIGKLEKVDTGCFADGECYVEVNGKHVTVLMGWSRDTVGSVQGVPDFGALEGYIGKQVEVYAQEKVDGTYTLYGSEGFYVKVLEIAKTPSKPKVGEGCMIGGCSNQFCLNDDVPDMATTCEWTEAYACYQTATCEKQSSGKCGWVESKELNQCLKDAGSGADRI